MKVNLSLGHAESYPPLQSTQHGEMNDENNVSKLFKQTLAAHPAEPTEKVNLTQPRAQASKKGKEPDDGTTSRNITRPVYTLAGNTTSPSPAKTIDDESSFNREKDMQILLEILTTLENYEQEGLEVKSVLKKITSLCGGSSGITYKDDNPKCIRNRYGRDKTIEPKGFINFALLHRAFIILEADIPAPEHIKDDFRKLKSKIAYILAKENIQKTLPLTEGDEKDLEVIYQYVKDNYYDVSIPRIASELDSLRDQTIKNKEDLYFFGRKLIIIGELCHEIEKDIRNIQDDEANSDQLKEIIESFKAINKERNNFVHPRALVKQFLELDQDNKLKSKLYDVILEGLKLIHSPQTKEILKAALGTREISEKGVKQKRKIKKEKTLTSLEKKLRKSDEYTRLLDTCRIIENISLSVKEQQSIKFGEIPEVDKLINIGNKLNIFSQVNALKMLRVKFVHESNLTDTEYRKCFEAAIGSDPFDITSFEDCERILAKIATFSTKIDWKIREEFAKHPQMPELFSKLRYIFHIYNESQMPSSAELLQTLSLSAELKGRTWVLHKEIKEEERFKKLTVFYTNLNKTVKAHELSMSNEKYSKVVSTATQGIEEFSILRKDCVISALNTIAMLKEGSWEAKEKSHTRLVQVLTSSCSTHVIKDPRTLESRIKEELKDERTRLIQKIDEEIDFAAQINRAAGMEPQRKRAIQEYVVTIIGQCMRELGEIGALEQTLLSQTAREAGLTMRTLRSKGLAHEILRFDSNQFEKTFKEIILPAKSDFNAIQLLHSPEKMGSIKMRLDLGIAYDRLNFPLEAANQFRLVIDYLENNRESFRNDLAQYETLQNIKEEEFLFTVDTGLVVATTYLASIYNRQSDYIASLEAIGKVLDLLEKLIALNLPELNNYIAILYLRYGECLYYTGSKDQHAVALAYDRAFQAASDPIIKVEMLIGGSDRACKLMRDFSTINDDLLANIEKGLIQTRENKNLTTYSRYKLLEIKLQIDFLKNQTDSFKITYKESLKFLNQEKADLKEALGDFAEFLIFETMRINLYRIHKSNNLQELESGFEEFIIEYEKVEKLGLHKSIGPACCAHHLSDVIRLFVEKNHESLAAEKLLELLNKSKFCLDCARINNREEFVKTSANYLVHAYFNLRNNGECFKKIALELGRDYNLELIEIRKIVLADIHYLCAQKSDTFEKAIFHFTQAIKSLKSLNIIDAANRININNCKTARSSVIRALILKIISQHYSIAKPAKGKLLVNFSLENFSLKKLNRYLKDILNLAVKAKTNGNYFRALIPIAKIPHLLQAS